MNEKVFSIHDPTLQKMIDVIDNRDDLGTRQKVIFILASLEPKDDVWTELRWTE